MSKRAAIYVLMLGIALAAANLVFKNINLTKPGTTITTISPYATRNVLETLESNTAPVSIFSGKKNLNVLLIGTDTSLGRRERGQVGFNTDVLVLVSINPETNKVLLTSVPRDLWVNDNKINALYTIYGWEVLQDAFQKITGQMVDGYIVLDFDGFEWVVDSFGGVPVEVKNTFADSEFPNQTDSDITTVSFSQGQETMSGERALTYARSRKGNNGEGSDLMRAKRQHLILQGMVSAISQPKSIFWPMDVPKFYDLVTKHMETSLEVADVYYLWDFYKDKDKYSIESFVVGEDYVYHPGMYPESPYHAWVFIPRNDSFVKLHEDINAKLDGTYSIASDTIESTVQQP